MRERTARDRGAMIAQLVALLVGGSGRGGYGRVHGAGMRGHGLDHGGHRRFREWPYTGFCEKESIILGDVEMV